MSEYVLQTASFVMSICIMFACIYNFATVLPMRGRPMYAISSMLSIVVINAIPQAWPGANQVHFALYGLVLPLALMRGPLSQRLVAIALCIGVLFIGEFLLTAALALVAGPVQLVSAVDEHVVLALAFRTVHVLITLIGGHAIRILMTPHLREERMVDVLPQFGASVLLNTGFAVAFYYIAIAEDLSAGDPVCIGGMLLSILFIALDASLLLSLERARRGAVANARARAAQERLEACLDRYERVSQATVRTARLRHDARSHVQTIMGLVAEGDSARAARYAREMAVLLRADDDGAIGESAPGDGEHASRSPAQKAQGTKTDSQGQSALGPIGPDGAGTSHEGGDTACSL